jgi:hypothetical protein
MRAQSPANRSEEVAARRLPFDAISLAANPVSALTGVCASLEVLGRRALALSARVFFLPRKRP